MDFNNLKSVLENTEQEAEQAVEKRDECENREASIRDAISKLGDDVQLLNRLQQNEQNAAGQRQEAQQEVELLKTRAQELESELQEMIKQNSESGRTLNQLQELGEDVQEGLCVLLERQTLIEECTERLQSIIEKLGLDSAEFGSSNVKQIEAVQQEKRSEHIDESKTNNEQRSNPFKDGLKAETKPLVTCGGIRAFGNIPAGYKSVIENRIQTAPKAIRKLFDMFAAKLVIQNTEHPKSEVACYIPENYIDMQRGIYLNAEMDLIEPAGAGTSFFHEIGHMIDHAAKAYKGWLSNTDAFKNALLLDGQCFLRDFKSMEPEEKKAFLKILNSDMADSCSDLLDAVTNGQIHGAYVHDRQDWDESGALQAEAFAHFFEAYMGNPGKRKLLTQVFPNAHQEFKKLVLSITNPDELRELELIKNTRQEEEKER